MNQSQNLTKVQALLFVLVLLGVVGGLVLLQLWAEDDHHGIATMVPEHPTPGATAPEVESTEQYDMTPAYQPEPQQVPMPSA